MNKYKTLEELKEELGDKFEEYLYKTNIEMLSTLEKIKKYCNYNIETLYTFEPDYDYEENMIDNYEISNFREDILRIIGE